MFAGGGAIITSATLLGSNAANSSLVAAASLIFIGLAHGLGIGVMIAAAGHISGGVYNPAITVGLVATRKLPVMKGVYYIVAQLLGGVVAALLLKVLFPADAVNATKLAVPALGAGVSPLQGVGIEFILTFFLQFVIFGTAIDKRGPATIAGLAIGLTIAMDVFAAGPLTGAAMNPARSFGPALIQGAWADQWVWWVGPILGALAAALLHNSVLLEPVVEREPSIELPQAPSGRQGPPPHRRRR
ncbi:MAG: aquaporin [Chloroflexi bacterium]|nr:aquaporin [Chloroflexota bacterium]